MGVKTCIFFGLVLIQISVCATPHCCTNISKQNESAILQVLQNQRQEWICDGACDTGWIDLPEVKQLVMKHREQLIPIFIANLDNSGPTQITSEGTHVTVGLLCFDLLCTITKKNNIWVIPECSDDGFWANVREEFWIGPESNANQIKSAQKHWRAMFIDGKLNYNSDWE
jgi:hypothetical protein